MKMTLFCCWRCFDIHNISAGYSSRAEGVSERRHVTGPPNFRRAGPYDNVLDSRTSTRIVAPGAFFPLCICKDQVYDMNVNEERWSQKGWVGRSQTFFAFFIISSTLFKAHQLHYAAQFRNSVIRGRSPIGVCQYHEINAIMQSCQICIRNALRNLVKWTTLRSICTFHNDWSTSTFPFK